MYCELCKRDIDYVDHSHLRIEHSITSKDYKKMFPQAMVVSIKDVLYFPAQIGPCFSLVSKRWITEKIRIKKQRGIVNYDNLEIDNLTIYSHIRISNKYLRKAMYKVFNGRCFYTNQKLSFSDMNIDHIMPKSKGGKNCIANYVVSCAFFNIREKRNRILHNIDELIRENIEVYSDAVLAELKSLLRQRNFNHKLEKCQ